MNGYFKGAAFTLWSHYENIMFEKTVINIHYNCRPPSCMLMLMCFGIQTGLFARVCVHAYVNVRVRSWVSNMPFNSSLEEEQRQFFFCHGI